ncbi:hypothetical protein BROUX41_003975 [Berkeleyomyces rouxiae]|uniref:uncharacterized protein n=1 Tax=Berkeleyomyces rouxiae TaxID=2035830 RepID=UPI003B7F3E39
MAHHAHVHNPNLGRQPRDNNNTNPNSTACHDTQRPPSRPRPAPTAFSGTLNIAQTGQARPGIDLEVKARTPRRKDDRLILHFDYDCFYASVFEKHDPSLKTRPLAVRQKAIVATCNYVARAHGVKKLSLLHDARKACPNLVVVDGEDLTLFRDESKALCAVLAAISWNGKVERLGFDEVFLDVTDIIDYNISCLNMSNLASSFFHLSRQDPQHGFACDLTSFAGPVFGLPAEDALSHARFSPTVSPNNVPLHLLLGSHLARFLRQKLEDECGFTCTCGIATNKLLSKIAGTKHKPRNQTTLVVWTEEAAMEFMDGHTVRQIPGIGSRIANALYNLVYSHVDAPHGVKPDSGPSHEKNLTVSDVRNFPGVSAALLEDILGGTGAERGIGERIWSLLHGVDNTPVKNGSSLPTQISIEDTYRQLSSLERIYQELRKLSASLIQRMRKDLVGSNGHEVQGNGFSHHGRRPCWLAKPKTLRLSLKNAALGESISEAYRHRVSRSLPVPSFLFDLDEEPQQLASRLVDEKLKGLLRKFGITDTEWNLILLSVCVANMTIVANEARGAASSGRDIARMFQRQDEVLRPFRVVKERVDGEKDAVLGNNTAVDGDTSEDTNRDPQGRGCEGLDPWEDVDGDSDQDDMKILCPLCGSHFLPFALPAHLKYHELGESHGTYF